MQISKDFSLEELTKSQEALRRGLPNNPTLAQQDNLVLLVQQVLQPLRDIVGPLVVNSGFRSKAVNDLVGSSNTSQHLLGKAADIEAIRIDNLKLAKMIQANLPFDELILECYTPGEPRSGWVHVSYSSVRNRKEVLTMFRQNGKVVYEAGLKEA